MSEANNVEVRQLGRDECYRLLASVSVGRVAVNAPGWPPVIRPVTHRFDEITKSVVFRTGRGSKLTALLLSQRAAFEVDGIDEETETGWSVILSGPVEAIDNVAELARLSRLGLRPWFPGDTPHWIRLRAATVSGICITGQR